MMINLLSFPSSQQCYFLQILAATQGAGDLTAPAFITFMAMQCWEEISWVEGEILGRGKSTWLGQCLLFGSSPAHVTSHAPQPSLVSPRSPTAAPLRMKLSDGGSPLARGSCSAVAGARAAPGSPGGRTCLVGQVCSSVPCLRCPSPAAAAGTPPVLFRPACPDFLCRKNRIQAEGEGSGACLQLILTWR